MRVIYVSRVLIPAAAGSMFLTMSASGQIQPDGYTCSSSFMRTHNNSTDITIRTVACGGGFQSAYAHWYDL
ncbi:MAG: hypothetical protein O7G85_06765, partial [Planctomycetota bacterium]|nr:hypothetical protein [Planctomycetota bacterium]